MLSAQIGSQRGINSCLRLRTPILIFTVLAAAAWAVYRSGPKLLAEEFLEYSIRWPVLDAPEGTDFIYSSPTGMLIFQSLGGQGQLAYVILHALMIIVAIGALALWTLRFVGSNQKIRSLRFILLSPIFAVLLQSIGGYDPFTLLGIIVALFGWSLRLPWLFVASSVYLGFQHFEQAVVLSVVWWLAYRAMEPHLPEVLRGLQSALWLLPGILLGKGILTVVLTSAGGRPLGTRGAALLDWADIGASIGVNRLPMTLWGGFAGLWVVVFFVLSGSERGNQLRLSAAIVLALVFSLMTIDNLRVFVMLTVPVSALLLVVANTHESLCSGRWARVTEGLMWLGPPQPTSNYALNDLHNFVLEVRSLGK